MPAARLRGDPREVVGVTLGHGQAPDPLLITSGRTSGDSLGLSAFSFDPDTATAADIDKVISCLEASQTSDSLLSACSRCLERLADTDIGAFTPEHMERLKVVHLKRSEIVDGELKSEYRGLIHSVYSKIADRLIACLEDCAKDCLKDPLASLGVQPAEFKYFYRLERIELSIFTPERRRQLSKLYLSDVFKGKLQHELRELLEAVARAKLIGGSVLVRLPLDFA